jgi:hypothetical protein
MVGGNNIGRPSIQPNLHYHSGLATQGDLNFQFQGNLNQIPNPNNYQEISDISPLTRI